MKDLIESIMMLITRVRIRPKPMLDYVVESTEGKLIKDMIVKATGYPRFYKLDKKYFHKSLGEDCQAYHLLGTIYLRSDIIISEEVVVHEMIHHLCSTRISVKYITDSHEVFKEIIAVCGKKLDNGCDFPDYYPSDINKFKVFYFPQCEKDRYFLHIENDPWEVLAYGLTSPQVISFFKETTLSNGTSVHSTLVSIFDQLCELTRNDLCLTNRNL